MRGTEAGGFAMPLAAIVVFLLALSSSSSLVRAGFVAAYNTSANVANNFNDNDTVYVMATDAADPSSTARVYVVANSDSWTNGTALIDVSTGYRDITTDINGDIPMTVVWQRPNAGYYDIVVDRNKDGFFNYTIDDIDNATQVGFTVIALPKPTLALTLGSYHPADYEVDLVNDTGHQIMMHFNATTNQYKDVKLNTVTVAASGTGNERSDVKVSYFMLDVNANGVYDDLDSTLSYMSFNRDEGILTFEIPGGINVPAGSSRSFIISYDMKNGTVGSTYSFELTTASATDSGTGLAATVTGLPLNSAEMTISGVPPTTTTVSTSTTTTSVLADECQTDDDCTKSRCEEKTLSAFSCKADPNKGVNVCAPDISTVTCCSDGDCPAGFYCLDYDCTANQGGEGNVGGEEGFLGINPTTMNYILIGISVIVVITLVALLFLYVRNRKKPKWKGKDDYERDWNRLKEKWKNESGGGES